MVLFAAFVFFAPDAMGHADNYIPANPLQTPQHIVPEWYLLPYYAMLRAIPNKLMGVIALGVAIGVLFILPWIDTSKVRSMRYRPMARWFFFIFIVTCIVLGWCGAHEPDATVVPGVGPGFNLGDYPINSDVWLSRLGMLSYFGFFASLFLVPMFETPLPTPQSISEPVLSHPAAVPAGATAAAEKKG
jgi:ubiquinol-cytochrome c reductase cytochrome b subunit